MLTFTKNELGGPGIMHVGEWKPCRTPAEVHLRVAHEALDTAARLSKGLEGATDEDFIKRRVGLRIEPLLKEAERHFARARALS